MEHDLAVGIFRAAGECSRSIGGSTTVHDFHTVFDASAISGAAQPVEYLLHFVQSDGRAVFSFEGEGQVRELSPMRTCLPRTSLRWWKKRGESSRVGSLRMPAVLPLDVMAELLGPTAKMT
jgi:hypothetical protein